jgi:hypothetical protein
VGGPFEAAAMALGRRRRGGWGGARGGAGAALAGVTRRCVRRCAARAPRARGAPTTRPPPLPAPMPAASAGAAPAGGGRPGLRFLLGPGLRPAALVSAERLERRRRQPMQRPHLLRGRARRGGQLGWACGAARNRLPRCDLAHLPARARRAAHPGVRLCARQQRAHVAQREAPPPVVALVAAAVALLGAGGGGGSGGRAVGRGAATRTAVRAHAAQRAVPRGPRRPLCAART